MLTDKQCSTILMIRGEKRQCVLNQAHVGQHYWNQDFRRASYDQPLKLSEQIGIMPPEEAEKNYPVLWEAAKELLPKLNREQIAIVISLATGVCPYCREDVWGCQCENDE